MREPAPRLAPCALVEPSPSSDDWVRTVREAHAMSTTDLATLLDVPVWRVEHWELDRRLPKSRKIRHTLNHYAERAGLPTR